MRAFDRQDDEMNLIHIMLEYFRERQPPMVRWLHMTILCLVLSQIVVSNFMGFADNGEVSRKSVEYFGTWIHIGTGLFLFPTTLVFIVIEIRRHGMKHFFPYVYGDFSQLKKDLQQLKRFELPEPDSFTVLFIFVWK